MKYALSTPAKEHLRAIRAYTLRIWGAQQSANYVVELKDVFELLSENQNLGQVCGDFGGDIFRYHHKSHTVYYSKFDDKIIIVAVLHQSMVPVLHR